MRAMPNDGGGQKCYLIGMDSKFTLADLERRIGDRATAPAAESYTRQLLDKGPSQCAKKFGEEAVEAVLAVVGESRERVIAESADVLYHLFVMLGYKGVALQEVEAELARRFGISGIVEKQARMTKPE